MTKIKTTTRISLFLFGLCLCYINIQLLLDGVYDIAAIIFLGSTGLVSIIMSLNKNLYAPQILCQTALVSTVVLFVLQVFF